MIGGAWPFLVRGVICLLNCVSPRAYIFTVCCRHFDPSFTGARVLMSLPAQLGPESNERDRNLLLPLYQTRALQFLIALPRKEAFSN